MRTNELVCYKDLLMSNTILWKSQSNQKRVRSSNIDTIAPCIYIFLFVYSFSGTTFLPHLSTGQIITPAPMSFQWIYTAGFLFAFDQSAFHIFFHMRTHIFNTAGFPAPALSWNFIRAARFITNFMY